MKSTSNERKNITQTLKKFVVQKIPNSNYNKFVVKLNLSAVATVKLKERINKINSTSTAHIYNIYNKKVIEIMSI